jgi:pentapeptide MXKDX repeat protein
MTKDAMSHDTMSKDAMKKDDAMSHDAMKKDDAKSHEAMKKDDAMAKDSMAKDAMKKDESVSDCSGCLMGHSDVLLVLLSPRSFSERFGAGARPVHPILGSGATSDLSPLSGANRKWDFGATKTVVDPKQTLGVGQRAAGCEEARVLAD